MDQTSVLTECEVLRLVFRRGVQNPFHIKELYSNEFESLLKKHYVNVKILSQKYFFGSLVFPESSNNASNSLQMFRGNYYSLEKSNEMEAMYLIGIASNSTLPETFTSVFDGEEILNKLLEDKVAQVKRYTSFIVGETILKPFRLIKSLLQSVRSYRAKK